jgi:eukaryotic-like serine/threonine-protein kinase
MPLAAGDRLGPYVIEAPIGSGGMGEVYRARDTRLDRIVAIKILPPALASDPLARARFDREAHAISQLDHPHICALYDVGEHEDTAYLVMQYLEGETLQERLTRGALTIDQTLRVAAEIAGALDRAHRAGIVHRDLKPGNIMLTKSGARLLDFGLARTGVMAATTGVSMLPTTPRDLTVEGTILGTFQYMAPEQLEGREADARTDIFALGAVIYEMATGRKAFAGKTQATLIAAIMSSEPPPISTLQPLSPPLLDYVIRTCLAKDPDERWQTTADVERQLRWIGQAPSSAASGVATSERAGARVIAGPLNAFRHTWTMMAIGIALGALIASAIWWWFAPLVPMPAVVTSRLSVVLPSEHPLYTGGSPRRFLAISPDGSRVVYVGLINPASADGARWQLFLRDLQSVDVQPLAGTGNALQPFFSPDGTWVGFFTTSGEMRKVSVAGGPPIVIAKNVDSAQWATAAWLRDGTIVFGSVGASGLQRISSDGGTSSPVTVPARGETHFQPAVVPGSRALLFTVLSDDGRRWIETSTLDAGQRRTVVDNAVAPVFLDSHRLAFARDGIVLEAPFDTTTIALAGSPRPLVDQVRFDRAATTPQLAVTANGTRVYAPSIDTRAQVGIVSRSGMFEPLSVPAGDVSDLALSPDGQRLAYTSGRTDTSEVRIFDIARGSAVRLTRKPPESAPAWSPDGRSIAVSTLEGLAIKDTGGSERATVPRGEAQNLRNVHWSPDGAVLAYTTETGASQDIWVVRADGSGARRVIAGSPSAYGPRFSPDGKWLAFTLSESGRTQVYVQRYPEGERLAVSSGGGTGPVWRRDGRELFFQGAGDGVGKLFAVSVSASRDSLVLGTPQALFNLRLPAGDGSFGEYLSSGNGGTRYGVFPDGQRFLMIRGADPEGARELVVVQRATAVGNDN